MLTARFSVGGREDHGVVDGGVIRRVVGDVFGEFDLADGEFALDDVRLLAPVRPSKVLVIGRNYGEATTDDLVVNLKPSTAVIGPGDPVLLPPNAEDVRFEGELAVVIGARCRDVSPDDWGSVVHGYTCGNDVTAWDVGLPGGHWTKAKSFDTFCPLGPWIDTAVDPGDLTIRTTVNGELRQDGSTSQMIRDVGTLVARCSRLMTLLPGDVILTGTPAGGGSMRDGDEITVRIGGIGELSHPVRAAATASA
ncbi:fumarylacetoacetate hydrolase family protein [Kutzneria buriramensis]|uniref:2-keto-4-pentenoate hydratase/2-oxohepta-3-ene-1,7-dioic acid hydratase in catechol pathway n=1 Tax=Kutzneria buriramensis TaxID=1045776 RepID=A0A3E0G604_9PSEU|nr:fumarylacetoacetate hydrolase family protein [Kutzneria buriramensis]REH18153.1 2-keto-4-pentenoate hydratase/2-oxohepta-3-ene-1,7-dioic acid hydratase in catechol pathway [Kutzneria buriramensis]